MKTSFLTTAVLAATAIAAAVPAAARGPAAVVVRLVPAPYERLDAPMRAVNDCATHVKARVLQLARPACDRAVVIAKRARPVHLRRSLMLAAALSNHALLELLSGDLAAAESDIVRAMKLAPDESFVARNRLAIEYAMAERRIAQQMESIPAIARE